MISTCLSIVEMGESHSFVALVINFPTRTVASASFSPDGRSINPADRYRDIWDFLGTELSSPETTQVILAVPTMLNMSREEDIPALTLPSDSLHLKIVRYLAAKRYCSFLQGSTTLALEDGSFPGRSSFLEIAVLTVPSAYPQANPLHIGPPGAPMVINVSAQPPDSTEKPPPYKLMFLYPSMAHAYAHFLFGTHPSLQLAALAAGLIAHRDGLYYYINSRGVVQSSQDIVEFLKYHDPRLDELGSLVVSASDLYTARPGSRTRRDKLDQIPLKYAVAMQKYHQFVQPEPQRQKFALLTVCKLWGLQLFCRRITHATEGTHLPGLTEEYLLREPASSLSQSPRQLPASSLVFDPEFPVVPWIEEVAKSYSTL